MKRQLRIRIDAALADRFKQAVLAQHGKGEISREGEQAIRLYLATHGDRRAGGRSDPLLSVIGIASSKTDLRPDALRDKMALRG